MDWTILFQELTKGASALISEPGRILMMVLGGVLIYLAVAKDYEPTLLIPIGLGCILANIFGSGITGSTLSETNVSCLPTASTLLIIR